MLVSPLLLLVSPLHLDSRQAIGHSEVRGQTPPQPPVVLKSSSPRNSGPGIRLSPKNPGTVFPSLYLGILLGQSG